MNKENYLESIRKKLSGLPQSDIDHWIEYYSEMIDDRLEDNMTEAEAIEAIGTPEEVSEQILLETPFPKLIKAKVTPSRSLNAWEIVLLVLGAPLWISLLIAAFAVVLSVYITIWAVVITLYAADFTIAVGALAGILASVVLIVTGQFAPALVFLGAGVLCFGISALLLPLFNLVTRGAVRLGALILRGIKRIFISK